MSITIKEAEILLKGQHVFKQVGFSMLLTKLKNLYACAPTSATLENCFKEINAFLNKYKTIMSIDIAVIESLKAEE